MFQNHTEDEWLLLFSMYVLILLDPVEDIKVQVL
jgi:hypothetical protein